MNGRLVYLAGYGGGREPQWLLAACLSLDACVFDTRHSPRSRRPEWSKANLSGLLGDRYRHIPGWGNLAYKSTSTALADIRLADFEAGLAAWDQERRPVVLLCQCPRTERCHRRLIAALLARERGAAAIELGDALREQEPRQLALMEEAE